MTPQLVLFSLTPPEHPPDHPTERPRRTRPNAKPQKDRQDIRQKWTREESEQEERAMWAGACVRIPLPGVPQLWTSSPPGWFSCSWCGSRFNARTNETRLVVREPEHGPVMYCPRCPVEHPENRPARLPVDEDQGELFDG